MLKSYFSELSVRIEPSLRAETLNDVEMRVADLLSGFLASPRQVVTTDHIRRVISIIGSADEFGEPSVSGEPGYSGKAGEGQEGSYSRPGYGGGPMRRLRRSINNRVIGGVCGGLAYYFNVDPVLVRVLAFIAMICSVGTAVFVYLAMWIVIPSEAEL